LGGRWTHFFAGDLLREQSFHQNKYREVAMYTKEKIYGFLQETLVSLFEIAPDAITPEANLYEDLDIDSIDAVDLTVKLKEFTGRRIQPSDFKQVRTVQDVVDAVYELLNRLEEVEAPAEANQS
jgi:acyl carrier protein